MNAFQFVKTAVKDYRVGAVTASSKYAIRRVLRELPHGAKFVVEYGAGDGVMTKEILRCLPHDGRVVAIELNSKFLPELENIGDPRLRVIHDNVVVSSSKLHELGLPRIDAVVSGIPFTFLSPKERYSVVAGTHTALTPGGRFIIYQFSLLIVSSLKRWFKDIRIRFEPRNFPPYFVMRAEK